jgi:lipopolysaccharide transport system ATP-binding protein
VERFLDTPVKRYSSGMYVRLAFAVAAHLEPEILIIDEVLAVGDAEFQKKCLDKMKDVAGHGRTVLFVSHNLQAIRQLCTRSLLLQNGGLLFSGSVHEATTAYMGSSVKCGNAGFDLSNYPRGSNSSKARLTRVTLLDENNRPVSQIERNSILKAMIHFRVEEPLAELDIPMALVHVEGVRICSESYSDQLKKLNLTPGDYAVEFTLPMCYLKLESYFLVVGLYNGGEHCDLVEGLPLPVLSHAQSDSFFEARRWGVVRLPISWSRVTAA